MQEQQSTVNSAASLFKKREKKERVCETVVIADNGPIHESQQSIDKVLRHPPYRPFSTTGFFLSPLERSFVTKEELKEAVGNLFFSEKLEQLVVRRHKCKIVEGGYFEK